MSWILMTVTIIVVFSLAQYAEVKYGKRARKMIKDFTDSKDVINK